MLRGKPGYGGTNPCAQTAGERTFYEEFQNPVDLLLNGDYRHIPVFFGANSHEGGEVVKGNFETNLISIRSLIFMQYPSIEFPQNFTQGT